MRYLVRLALTLVFVLSAALSAAAQSITVAEPQAPAPTLSILSTVAGRDARFQPQFRGAPPQTDLLTATGGGRPKALLGLYASLASVQVLDVVSTRAALRNGAVELNPTLRGSVGAQLGVKAAMTLGTVALAERLWRKNRIAAIGTMIAANGAMAMITAHNLRNAR